MGKDKHIQLGLSKLEKFLKEYNYTIDQFHIEKDGNLQFIECKTPKSQKTVMIYISPKYRLYISVDHPLKKFVLKKMKNVSITKPEICHFEKLRAGIGNEISLASFSSNRVVLFKDRAVNLSYKILKVSPHNDEIYYDSDDDNIINIEKSTKSLLKKSGYSGKLPKAVIKERRREIPPETSTQSHPSHDESTLLPPHDESTPPPQDESVPQDESTSSHDASTPPSQDESNIPHPPVMIQDGGDLDISNPSIPAEQIAPPIDENAAPLVDGNTLPENNVKAEPKIILPPPPPENIKVEVEFDDDSDDDEVIRSLNSKKIKKSLKKLQKQLSKSSHIHTTRVTSNYSNALPEKLEQSDVSVGMIFQVIDITQFLKNIATIEDDVIKNYEIIEMNEMDLWKDKLSGTQTFLKNFTTLTNEKYGILLEEYNSLKLQLIRATTVVNSIAALKTEIALKGSEYTLQLSELETNYTHSLNMISELNLEILKFKDGMYTLLRNYEFLSKEILRV